MRQDGFGLDVVVYILAPSPFVLGMVGLCNAVPSDIFHHVLFFLITPDLLGIRVTNSQLDSYVQDVLSLRPALKVAPPKSYDVQATPLLQAIPHLSRYGTLLLVVSWDHTGSIREPRGQVASLCRPPGLRQLSRR